MKKNILFASLLVTMTLLVWLDAQASAYHVTIHLKDGTTVKGELLQMSPTGISIDPEGPVVYRTIFADQIDSVYLEETNQTLKYPLASEDFPSAFSNKNTALVPRDTSFSGGRFSLGVLGGYATGVASEAIDGFKSTEFGGSSIIGGSIGYMFESGVTLEISVSHLKMELSEAGLSYGKLGMTPVIFLVKFQKLPYRGVGTGFHADIGGGIMLTDFEKGYVIKEIENYYGVDYSIKTDNSFAFELGGGIDLFFSKRVSLIIDARLLLGNTGTKWMASGYGGTYEINQINSFLSSNFQIMTGLKIWFPMN